MKYFIDTEFIEGRQKTWFGRQTKPTIDIISIGIVDEDGREYYAISKDFNLKEAWNRYDLKPDIVNGGMKKVYWIRENVLKHIYNELAGFHIHNYGNHKHFGNAVIDGRHLTFTYKNLKWLINNYGKPNEQIAEEVKDFVSYRELDGKVEYLKDKPEFYGYYCDYDWVVFCWLFGRMIELPKGFPMYCKDIKQMLDERLKTYTSWATCPNCTHNVYEGMLRECIKEHPHYPKQTNEHNALEDARWNYELWKFINMI